MFGLPGSQNGIRLRAKRKARRKSDDQKGEAEVAVLKALHVAARRSSPHRAVVRASIARAISVIEASTLGLCHISELVDECLTLCRSGLATDDWNKRAILADRYGEVIAELNAIAHSSGHGGYHLIDDSGCTCEVDLGTPEKLKLKLPHINLTSGANGLALPKPTRAFADNTSLGHFETHLALVRNRLDHAAALFREHGADLAKRLALVLEYAIPEEEELTNVPQASGADLSWGRRV